ncbi:histidine kinase [Arthrobacter sp. PAMC 25486]|uniref:sensor histidine kinase n=1 Tax=Arthrobacter sp. PAMC 25486 TaxID=1494608 RepID=UPI0005362240|nr:histidine kinase [Arthrobacter sp. PAMC 25486]AIY00059.1 histidine kinase [Arthrobacter sp. PAMC 25486]
MDKTVWHALAGRPWHFWGSRWPWRSLLYVASGAVLGLVLLPLVVVTFVLIPLWALAVGALERRRVRLLGFARIESAHVPVGRGERRNWLNIRLAEAATWRAVGSLFATLLLGCLSMALLFIEALAVGGSIAVAAQASRGPTRVVFFGDFAVEPNPGLAWLAYVAVLMALALSSYANALLAAGQGALTRVLLAPRERELERNIQRLTQSRISLVAAFEQERKRIERDLHDGVQQELVALSVRLGLAEVDLELAERAGAPVGEARASVAAAHDHAEHALATLRATVRGIHPAVLSDHGLEAALQELAGRAGQSVTLDAQVGRMDAATEACAYFTVSEALTNAVKYALASEVKVTALDSAGRLQLTITDNGRGGADPTRGTGLNGLMERAETLGGTLAVDSPPGGPTTLSLILPTKAGIPPSTIP